MIKRNRSLLIKASLLAVCVILLLHLLVFPVYDVKQEEIKSYLDLEKSLCHSHFIKRKYKRRYRCPRHGIVTIMQSGRLGNLIWEYASVFALSKQTGLEPFVPRCIRIKLDFLFSFLSVPSFEEIRHCTVDVKSITKSPADWNFVNQSIVLPSYLIQTELVLLFLKDIKQELKIKEELLLESERILQTANTRNRSIFVGIHIRRTDYIEYLWRKYTVTPASIKFYYDAMKYFRRKYRDVFFVIVSDDPWWCMHHFAEKRNVYITKLNSPSLDMAILASCNHSIFDYGTFGFWSALLAGGETIYYNLSQHSSAQVGRRLDNWFTL